jgi:hypothetical protein
MILPRGVAQPRELIKYLPPLPSGVVNLPYTLTTIGVETLRSFLGSPCRMQQVSFRTSIFRANASRRNLREEVFGCFDGYHDDLIEHAIFLSELDPYLLREPKQVDLRRAVSEAYCSLFHLLTT